MTYLLITSLVLILYPYCIYPLFLVILSQLKKKTSFEGEIFPSVSMIIIAYNEEKNIRKKIENSLFLDYPRAKLEIIIASDCSTDRTDEIISGYRAQGVILHRQDRHRGKSACLNDTAPIAKGEIILFTDANAMLDKDSVKKLVRHFSDAAIGFVTGRTKYISDGQNKTQDIPGIYTRLETFIKKKESVIGACVGADGAVFAIRKNLYTTLQSADINDLVIPLTVIRQGYRGILDEEALNFEETAPDVKGEFQRQVRITARTLRAIFSYKVFLNPFKYPLFSFQLFSHKLIRFLAPIFLFLFFISTCLLFPHGIIYKLIFLVQIIFYTLAIAGIKRIVTFKNPLLAIPINFIIMNFAFLIGWFKYFSGESYITWEPTGSL
jgi:cellulose synthase/poly-beta-1,6-N-acetylglucosamine synthase-like glycosyltransferase